MSHQHQITESCIPLHFAPTFFLGETFQCVHWCELRCIFLWLKLPCLIGSILKSHQSVVGIGSLNEQHFQDSPVIQSPPKGNKAKTQHIKRFPLINPSRSSADWTRLVHKAQLISSELSWRAKRICLNLGLRFDLVEKDFPSLGRKRVIGRLFPSLGRKRRLVGDPFLCSLVPFLTHPAFLGSSSSQGWVCPRFAPGFCCCFQTQPDLSSLTHRNCCDSPVPITSPLGLKLSFHMCLHSTQHNDLVIITAAKLLLKLGAY